MKYKVGDIVEVVNYYGTSIFYYGKIVRMNATGGTALVQVIATSDFELIEDDRLHDVDCSCLTPLKEALEFRLKQLKQQKDDIFSLWNVYGDKQAALLDEVGL